jgi:hypothetical protein
MMRRVTDFILPAALLFAAVQGFSPTLSIYNTRRYRPSLRAGAVELLDHAESVQVVLLQLTASTTTNSDIGSTWMLADSAAVVVESAGKDLGWWGAYVDLFKNALTLVHDTIEGPLRSIGVEQIWGISIAVFTACKYYIENARTVANRSRGIYLSNSRPNPSCAAVHPADQKCRVHEGSKTLRKGNQRKVQGK